MSTVNVLGSCSSMDDLSSLSKNKPRQDRAELKLQLPALHLDLSPTEAEELLPGNAWPAQALPGSAVTPRLQKGPGNTQLPLSISWTWDSKAPEAPSQSPLVSPTTAH